MRPDDPSPFRIRLMTALVIVGTFVAGVAAGLGLARWIRPPERPPPPMGLPLGELGLSPEQEAKARAIGERHRAELEAILRDTYPKVRAINEKLDAEVREILTPAQRRRLDEIEARRRPPRPGPRPPGREGPPGPGGGRPPGHRPPPPGEGPPPPGEGPAGALPGLPPPPPPEPPPPTDR